MKADVTIGIIVQDEWDSLKRTLYGLRNNTGYPYTLFILDDSSTHQSPTALDGIKRITVPEQGIPRCANLFIEKTDTPYLVLLDSTSYVTQDWLSLLINCLKSRPEHGIAGPSTSWSWNEQQIVNKPDWSISEIEVFGQKVKQKYSSEFRYLNQLHSINYFCYAFKREVVEKIGYFDERYGKGPCFEIDYNTRAARAEYKCVWVCGAYVHRFPISSTVKNQENSFFHTNKKLYQKKFCDLQLRKKRKSFCEHCVGEACEYFAPIDLIKIDLTKYNKAHSKRYEKKPLVSCIMPTYNRRLFVPQAIKYFLNQNYPNKELIIVDDGTDRVSDLIPNDDQIKYIGLNQRASIGSKRNIAVEQSTGEIIAHWDDDDWYGEDRISYQVQPLTDGKAEVCGLDTGFIYNICENTFWSCNARLHAMMFYADIHGGSIVFTRNIWEKYAKYPDISLAEDASFLRAISGKSRITKLPNKNVFIYIRHDSNAWEFICGKFINPGAWKNINPPSFLSSDDLSFYREVSARL